MALVIYAASTILVPAASPQPQVAQAAPAVAALQSTESQEVSGEVSPSNLLVLTNQERAKTGAAPLRLHGLLSSAAGNKCQDMVKNDYWSHVDQSGREPWHFIDATGYEIAVAGENLAYGFTTPRAVVEGWMNSPEHKEALLDPNYADVGFGICVSENFVGNGKQTVVVQHFGRQP